jgi:hypothetical protein
MEDSLIAKAVPVFVAPPVLPSVIVVPANSVPLVDTMNSMSVTQTAPKVALVPASSADVGFLQRGFLKPSFSVGRGCPPAAISVISLSRSHSEKYGFGLSSDMVVSDGEDGDF